MVCTGLNKNNGIVLLLVCRHIKTWNRAKRSFSVEAANTELHRGTGGSEGELLHFQCPANVMFLHNTFSVEVFKFRDYLSAR